MNILMLTKSNKYIIIKDKERTVVYDTLIKNALCFIADEFKKSDVFITDGIITEISTLFLQMVPIE
ncbi:MAG: hypothetical protein ACLUP7_02240 [Eubacterium sp.]